MPIALDFLSLYADGRHYVMKLYPREGDGGETEFEVGFRLEETTTEAIVFDVHAWKNTVHLCLVQASAV
jgi:hypothetical protein